MAQGEQF